MMILSMEYKWLVRRFRASTTPQLSFNEKVAWRLCELRKNWTSQNDCERVMSLAYAILWRCRFIHSAWTVSPSPRPTLDQTDIGKQTESMLEDIYSVSKLLQSASMFSDPYTRYLYIYNTDRSNSVDGKIKMKAYRKEKVEHRSIRKPWPKHPTCTNRRTKGGR